MRRIAAAGVALGLVLICAGGADAAIALGPAEYGRDHHVYYVLQPESWTAAQNEAIAMGGHLATLNDDAENGWTHAGFAYSLSTIHMWIGLTDAGSPPGVFKWSTGDPLAYTNWAPGQPSGGDYAYMYSPTGELGKALWYTTSNAPPAGAPVYALVEVDGIKIPEPAALGMLTLAAAALSLAQRPRRRVNQHGRS
jgi:hypothetical protein